MRPTNVLNNDQGFTLPELMTVVIIVGILAAFAAPGFLAWNQNKQADAAMTTVEGAIKEAQRQAMAKSRNCNVSFTRPSITTPPRVSSSNGCLVTGTRTLDNVSMELSTNDSSLTTASATAISFNFSHIGENMNASTVTIVLTHSGNSNLRRCVVVSQPLGLIGTGEYTGTTGTISNRCIQI